MGFPSPAQDYRVKTLDVNDHLVQNPDTTFFFAVENDALKGDCITKEHKVVVDRSVQPRSGHIVVAVINGEFFARRLIIKGRKAHLLSSSPDFAPMVFNRDNIEIWGVVVGSFRRHDSLLPSP